MDPTIINLQLIFIFFIFLLTIISSSSPSNFTLYGTAKINQTTITLTQSLTNCTLTPQFPNTGRIFHKSPFQFLNSPFNSTISFSTRFSFIIIPPPITCNSGEGITFFITSTTNPLPYSIGTIGLPQTLNANSHSSYLAIEFDTHFDRNLNDINDNHVAIDFNSVVSTASIDLSSIGIDLKSGKTINSWIEYNSSKKVIQVWVGYSDTNPDTKPDSPVLTAPIDLSKRFHRFMYVGFSGSNGDGSSVYVINNWEFKTFESGHGSVYPDIEVEELGSENCMICFPDTLHKETGPGTELDTDMLKTGRTERTGLKLAIGLLVVNLVLVTLTVCCVVMYVCLIKKQKLGHMGHPGQARPEQTRKLDNENTIPRRFKLSEIRSATKGFNRNMVIGEGVTAIVYKTDRNLAVKRFKTGTFDSQIVTEYATMVSSLHHKNLMKLKGWCCERNELVLVYDHMQNGSVDKNLEKLSFDSRLNVLIGVSSALVYLHDECDRLIVHRNVRSGNVMLDYDFVPKLGDFGFGMSREVTVTARAMGYMAPEYVYTRVPTVKTDVYSFGVVVLEVVTGRASVDDNGVAVADWVWDLWEEKRLVVAADSELVGKFDRIDMEMVLMVGLSCVHPNYEMRPSMKEVLMMLKGEMMVPELPEVKPTVLVQSFASERSTEVVVVKGGCGDDVLTSWGTPTSHFSKV
ncbi:hypothetical protein QVD17_38456 [Tagetes erecta]|uniref:Protein kinase domain-containing protein n=1 Tax=Tagetes erecta TaxID=13708 RepID=A0AAD8NG96_TARER|nr:hypothetical protein QVD17_38456 [Tagetes erecta]